MAEGTLIKLKRKAGAFSGGDLEAGETGVDTSNGDMYFSHDGSTVVKLGKASNNVHGLCLQGPVATGDEFHGIFEADVDLSKWQLSSPDVGDVELDVWVTTDDSLPDVSDSITDENYPALDEEDYATGTTSGFTTTSVSRGDRFVVKVNNANDITEIYFSLTN